MANTRKAGEYVIWNHPFLWGSKLYRSRILNEDKVVNIRTTGHLNHNVRPQSTLPDLFAILFMLVRDRHDRGNIQTKMETMVTLGVPIFRGGRLAKCKTIPWITSYQNRKESNIRIQFCERI